MPGEWQAAHIYYTGSTRPMITECVAPLARALTEERLIDGYFFINYWLEGPHVRLRLRPSSPAATAEVRARAGAAIDEFLRVRPALYEMRSEFYLNLYNEMFKMEFTDEERSHYVDSDGRMRLRPINTFSWEPYEPEFGKYGGPAGVALAEWHFQRSTDLVADALRALNLQLRPVLLGFAAQLMMAMCTSFLGDAAVMADYLDRYHRFWNRSYEAVNDDGTKLIADATYDTHFDAMSTVLGDRFASIRHAAAAGDPAGIPGHLVRAWLIHSDELRERVRAAAANGDLEFREWGQEGTRTITDPDRALRTLLVPYLHMTNNRLHVTIRDEAYLAYLLSRSLREGAEVG